MVKYPFPPRRRTEDEEKKKMKETINRLQSELNARPVYPTPVYQAPEPLSSQKPRLVVAPEEKARMGAIAGAAIGGLSTAAYVFGHAIDFAIETRKSWGDTPPYYPGWDTGAYAIAAVAFMVATPAFYFVTSIALNFYLSHLK